MDREGGCKDISWYSKVIISLDRFNIFQKLINKYIKCLFNNLIAIIFQSKFSCKAVGTCTTILEIAPRHWISCGFENCNKRSNSNKKWKKINLLLLILAVNAFTLISFSCFYQFCQYNSPFIPRPGFILLFLIGVLISITWIIIKVLIMGHTFQITTITNWVFLLKY